jgi:hypothetical protein
MFNVPIGKGIALLLLAGLVIGLALSDADVVNPITRSAEAERFREETDRLARQNEIDLHQYQILQQAHTQAELDRLEAERVYQERLYAQNLKNDQRVTDLKLQLIRLFSLGLVLAVGIGLLSVSLGLGLRLAQRPTLAQAIADTWTTERRRSAIAQARAQELAERARVLAVQSRLDELTQSNGRQNISLTVGSVPPPKILGG